MQFHSSHVMFRVGIERRGRRECCRANLQFHSTSVVIGTSFLVPTSNSDRVLKQEENGNAGRANLQIRSTTVVIGTVSQYNICVPIEKKENRTAGRL